MPIIKKITAREILDSRGNPTIEVEMRTESKVARAAVPSGASTGIHEAHELRDGGKRYNGKGVLKAIKNVKKIEKLLKNQKLDQVGNDAAMIALDGTKNKKNLGANAILGVSLCIARLTALHRNVPLYKIFGKKVLPTPYLNVINGGKHAGNGLAVQEFMIVPKASTFAKRLQMGTETYHVLKGIIKAKYGKDAINVGDEGGFAPNLKNVKDALDLLTAAIKKAGYKGKIKIAMDAAASEFYKNGTYNIDGKKLSPSQLSTFYESLV